MPVLKVIEEIPSQGEPEERLQHARPQPEFRVFDATTPPRSQSAGDTQALVGNAWKAAINDPDDHVELALAERPEKLAKEARRKPGSEAQCR